MAKFLVTSGSYYEPFTYDELARPLQQMADAQNATADSYDQLNMETEALRHYISENKGDMQAKALYDNYVNKLNTLQDNLWRNGYNAGTRRDLASARSAYASDITRLKTAIENRQARSKEYWDTKHKNPDMVMGSDPGLGGLDAYLNDDLYGSNWYSYSGTQFTNEVAADAKARANELLTDYKNRMDVQRDPRLAGYLTRIVQEGYTSQEVQRASDAAYAALQSGDRSGLDNLPVAEGILANVLLSHLDSTGARGNVSDSEFNRLFEYGRQGLSHAIGKTDVRELNDKVWDFNRQLALQSGKSSGGSGAKVQAGARPYSLDDISTFLKASNSDKLGKEIEKHFVTPFQSPIPIVNPDGTMTTINNPEQAENALDNLGRLRIKERFTIDPETLREGVYNMPNATGGTTPIKLVETPVSDFDPTFAFEPYSIQRQNEKGRWVKDEALTKEFNRMRKEYNDNYEKFKQQNPDVNLRSLTITQGERDEIERTGNISSQYGSISVNDIPYILATKSKVGRVTPAVIAGAGEDMESTRKNYGARIADAFARAPKSKKGKVAKTDESAFFPVDGYNISDEGEGDISKVFGTKKVGSNVVTNTDTISSIGVTPDDIVNNRVRITVNNRTWAINPAMLGNNMDGQIQALRGPVAEMMLPIFEPERALNMSDEEAATWIYDVSQYLGDYINLIGTDAYGNVVAIRPEDVVRNQSIQEQLRTAVTMFMNNVLAEVRDEMNLNNYRVRGNTSDKASSYNGYITEE